MLMLFYLSNDTRHRRIKKQERCFCSVLIETEVELLETEKLSERAQQKLRWQKEDEGKLLVHTSLVARYASGVENLFASFALSQDLKNTKFYVDCILCIVFVTRFEELPLSFMISRSL